MPMNSKHLLSNLILGSILQRSDLWNVSLTQEFWARSHADEMTQVATLLQLTTRPPTPGGSTPPHSPRPRFSWTRIDFRLTAQGNRRDCEYRSFPTPASHFRAFPLREGVPFPNLHHYWTGLTLVPYTSLRTHLGEEIFVLCIVIQFFWVQKWKVLFAVKIISGISKQVCGGLRGGVGVGGLIQLPWLPPWGRSVPRELNLLTWGTAGSLKSRGKRGEEGLSSSRTAILSALRPNHLVITAPALGPLVLGQALLPLRRLPLVGERMLTTPCPSGPPGSSH